MGFEYRLAVDPEVLDLPTVCEAVFASTTWRRIPTSFSDGVGLGVGDSTRATGSSWPQVADLRVEGPTSIYVVCHSQAGERFLEALVRALRAAGHVVEVGDDV